MISTPPTMMIKFRFLDPALARKYDSDGMATAIFTMVGFEDSPEGRTVFVPNNVVDDLRKALLTLMTFDCKDAFERKEVLPKIAANASFFAEVVSSVQPDIRPISDSPIDSVRRIEKATELRTREDVRKLLGGFCKGDDLKIWIKTSSYAILVNTSGNGKISSPPPGFESENKDPNKRLIKRTSPLPSSKPKKAPPLSAAKPKKAASSSLKAIIKAGNIKCRKPKISKPIETPRVNRSSGFEEKDILRTPETEKITMIFESEFIRHLSPISIPGNSYYGDAILDIPHHCTIENTYSDSTITTASDMTRTSRSSSISSADIALDIKDPNIRDSHDIETRHLLALAGCPGYGEFDDFRCSNPQDDRLLSIVSLVDTDCNINNIITHQDEIMSAAINHLSPSFFESKVSLSSVSSSSTRISSSNNVIWGWSNASSENSDSSLESSSSMTSSSPTKEANLFESSSLLEGSELEMANVLESVVDYLFVLGDSGKNTENGDAIAARVKIGQTLHSEFTTILQNCPCPTPKELLLAMGG